MPFAPPITSATFSLTWTVERLITKRSGDGPAQREIRLQNALALWISHAVNREACNDRRRVGRTRP